MGDSIKGRRTICRTDLFVFYAIEHYVDPSYKFSGLGAFLRYWRSKR